MKKLISVLFFAVFIIGCSSSDDSSSSSTYNPPSWIQGKWGLKANGSSVVNDIPMYRFTSNDVCQLIGGSSSSCWKDLISQSPSMLSGEDSETSTTYTASLISNGGVTNTFSFQKISATKIKWLNTPNGNIDLQKLD